MKNNNQNVIRRISVRSLKNNRMRNVFAIVAIALTAVLFTSLFTMGSGVVQVMEEQTMRQVGTRAHGGFKDVTKREYEKLVDHPLVKDYGYDIWLGNAENEELAKRQLEIRYQQPHSFKFGFVKLEEGKLPEKENEIVLDTIALDMLKIPYELGQEINLRFQFLDKEYNRNFVLSGWYRGDRLIGASTAYISEVFWQEVKEGWTDEAIQEANKSQPENNGVGLYQLSIMLKDSRNIKANIKKILADSGLELDDSHIAVNWAYMSEKASEMDFTSLVMLVVVFLVMMLTGFLIIYNIFQISMQKDIQFYGLLKTIGTTKKQIRKLVSRQALLLSCIGIPIGLFIGFFIGQVFMPVILRGTNVEGITNYSVKANPFIFLFAIFFSLFTIGLSCYKPSRIAGRVSPIEAIKYVENRKTRYRNKKSTQGARVSKMALANLARNKGKTAVVIISMSLSVVLLTEIVTFVKSFRLDMYLEANITGDLIISAGHRNGSLHMALADEFYEAALQQDGVEESSRLYHSSYEITHTLSKTGHLKFAELYKEDKLNKDEYIMTELKNTLEKNAPIYEQRYAYDEALLSKLKIIKGTLDMEKFRSGKYILATTLLDSKEAYYKPGDKVTLNFAGKNPQYKEIKDADGNIIDNKLIYEQQKEYEVMAVVELPYSMTNKSFWPNGLTTILPKEEFLRMDGSAEMFAASLTVEDSEEAAFSDFLESYTTQIDPSMDYQTKDVLRKELSTMTGTISFVGGALAFVIAIVGILNFINTMLTSVITRKREFAMLQSIGLTNLQLKKLLLFEGIYYVGFTAAISLVVGSLLSVTAIRAFNDIAACFQYQFTLVPFITTIPVFLVIALFVPLIAYCYVRKYSIVERLREE